MPSTRAPTTAETCVERRVRREVLRHSRLSTTGRIGAAGIVAGGVADRPNLARGVDEAEHAVLPAPRLPAAQGLVLEANAALALVLVHAQGAHVMDPRLRRARRTRFAQQELLAERPRQYDRDRVQTPGHVPVLSVIPAKASPSGRYLCCVNSYVYGP